MSVNDLTNDPNANIQTYRSNDGAHYWLLDFQKVGAHYRVYIKRGMDYGRRASDAHSTHRFYDSDRREHYICFDPQPTTLRDAFNVASGWAERTQAYIERGTSF